MKRYLLDLQLNTRDLGGILTQNKQPIIEGRFIRSDVPQYLSSSGKDFFHQLGITTVIDFRTDDIATFYPSVFSLDARFQYYRYPIVEGSQAAPTRSEDSPFTYMKMLDHEDTFANIFHVIAAAPGGVFYHCTAGKDRTGIVTFLLLDLIGVAEAVIVEDYAISEVFINERIHLVRAAHPDFPASLGFSQASYMQRFIPLFREKYQSALHYLRRIGLSEQEIYTITRKLLEK